MSSLEAKLEQMKPYLGCLIILLNMSGMGIGIGKTVEGWHHVSAGIAACGVIMCVLESICLACHLYTPVTSFVLGKTPKPKVESMLAVVAAVSLLATIIMLSIIKRVHHSASESVETLGWSVLALGILTLLLILATNGAEWARWVKDLIRKMISVYDEWMEQRRMRDEEHDLEGTRPSVPAT